MPPYDLPQYGRYAAYQPRDDRVYRGPRGRSRSPPRHYEYDNRGRSRSPSPYRRSDRPRQDDHIAPEAGRRGRREPDNPNGPFKGMNVHCFSPEGGTAAVQKLCRRMIDQGAIGNRKIEEAEIIVILGPRMLPMTTIKPDSTVPPIIRDKRPTLEQVYEYYATRVFPTRDPQRDMRKCVIQAEWAYCCLKKYKLLPQERKNDLEIQVDNTAPILRLQEQEAAPEAMEDIRPDTPPIPANPLPEIHMEPLPSFEYRQTEPVPSITRKVLEVRSLTDHWKPEIPTVVSAPQEISKVRRIAMQQGWTDSINSAPVPKAPALVPALSTSASITPAKLPVKVSVDPRLQLSARPLATASRPLATPSPRPTLAPALSSRVTPIPITIQQHAEPTPRSSSSPPQTIAPDSSKTAEATQELPDIKPATPTLQSKSARTGDNGVFARGQGMPWLFHVYGDDKMGITAMMIEELGGGQIAPIDLASTIVIPESGSREPKTEEIENIVRSVGFGREVVSIDWVSRCIKDNRLVDYDTYRITLPTVQTPIETRMDVERTVEEEPAPVSAPPVEMEIEAAPAPVLPVIQAETLQVCRSDIGSPHERQLSRHKRHLSPKPRKRNATAGPSGTRHSTPPRKIEIILVEDEGSDDDFIMLDTPPVIFKKSTTPVAKPKTSSVDRYPTPPMTPLAPDNERTRSPSQEMDTTITPIAAETASEEYDPSDHIPLERPQKRKPFTEMPLGLITDPEQREKDVEKFVPLDWRRKFRLMEKELHEWSQDGLRGTLIAFKAKMKVKHPTTKPGGWEYCYRNFRTLYHQSIPGLWDKGNKKLRGPRYPGDTPEPESSTV